jgi:predicted transcriptional regulator
MVNKQLLDKMSIYIPQSKLKQRPVERLVALGKKQDRSLNYLVVEAILQYVDREEKKPG